MNYVIGVDAGGTKTEAAAIDLFGNIIEKSTTGFGNLLNNSEEALNNITNAINELAMKLGITGLKAIYVGAAGAEVSNNALIIKKRLSEVFKVKLTVMNDAEIALKAKLKGEDGILIIAGTGSIVFGINNMKSAKCGGWGNLLGDEGSGYRISVDAIKQMIKEEEENIKQTELSKKIMEYLNIESVNEITGFVYSSTKDDIAVLAPIVSKLAENGESIAVEILKKEAEELAHTVENLYNKLNFTCCRAAIVGGVIKKSIIFKDFFKNFLKDKVNITELVDNDASPTMGAYYMYINENSKEEL